MTPPAKQRLLRWLMLLAVLWLGASLRIDGLVRDTRLHGDEALFASYGRLMVLHGDWNLYEVPVDKPPLTFAMVGVSLALLGESEFAVRVPNVLASVLSLALMFQVGRQITRAFWGGWLATLLVAFSPLEIAYAPTAFQDPPMLTALLVTTLLLLRHRWGWAGVAFGVALCMKPTALYLAPLLLGLPLLQTGVLEWRRLRNFVTSSVPPLGLLILWDESRRAQSFFTLGNYNNNPGRLIRADEVLPRLKNWLMHLSASVGDEWIGVGLAAMLGIWLWRSAQQRIPAGAPSWWVGAFSVTYMGWHWLVAFPTYDRYVLPLVPFLLLVGAQALLWMQLRWRVLLLGALIMSFAVQGGQQAAFNRIDPNTGHDIDYVATVLNRDYAGQIIYDFALGWHLRWYLGSDSTVQVVYWPTPEDLARHMQHDDGLRYLIALNAIEAEPWLYLLAQYNVQFRIVYKGDTMLYELTPPLVAGSAVSEADDAGEGFSSEGWSAGASGTVASGNNRK
jgi:4-amino-4-deoxy-L-arabinose transferase-like glycosyltransferase